tara:strand:+ start:1526 stop:2188 length:663 start_codon:yes stop_codon:yes gene_type:complete
MYFQSIPNIQYDTKPISYPFSESDYTIAKNFFRRYKINPDVFGYATFYDKYAVQDGVKLETIAKEYYGDPFYDWVIVLANNYINPLFSLPTDNYTLDKIIEDRYGDETYSTHHYETIETKSGETVDGINVIALKGGLTVDHNFYSTQFTYWDGTQHISVPGSTVSKPISNHSHETAENEKKREIYILKRGFFKKFINEFKTRNKYTKSSKFISDRLKKTG